MRTSRVNRSVAELLRPLLRMGWVALLVALALSLVWSSAASAADRAPLQAQAQSAIGADLVDSLAVRADGSLWVWGYYQEGEEEADPVGFLSPTRVGSDIDWASVSNGYYDSLALRNDGTLWDIQAEARYEGEEGNYAVTMAVTAKPIGLDADWAAVSAAGSGTSTLAIKADGSLWALEYDLAADPGDPDYDHLLPTRIGTDTDWVAVSAGQGFAALALKADGSLWLVLSEYEDLEDLDNYDLVYATEQVGTDMDWAAGSAGGEHFLGLKTDGSLWAWGENYAGQLGDGTTQWVGEPARIGDGNDWVAVSAGPINSLALKGDGTLWAWGDNEFGQVGDGTTTDRLSPTRVGTSNKWRAIAAGYMHMLATKADGTLWAWGDNESAQLGDGTIEERHSPVKVLTEVRVPEWPDQGEEGFSDVAGSPYEAAIYDLAGRGAIAGFEDGTFRPGDPVSRQQFAKMIVKALAFPMGGGEPCPFSDMTAQAGSDPLYPCQYAAVCIARGITQGKTATTFDPESDITRQQLVTMVVRAVNLANPPLEFAPGFISAQFCLEEHYRNARRAAYAGLLDGLQGVGPLYDFGVAATRGECALLLFNLLTKLES